MAKKIKVNDTFRGLVAEGDLVRFYTHAGEVDAVATNIDCEGDQHVDVPGVNGGGWILMCDCTHVKILKAAPKPQETEIGGVKLTITAGEIRVRGSDVCESVIASIAFAYDLIDPDGYYTTAELMQAYKARSVTISGSDEALRCGCVALSKEDAIAAITWIAQALEWEGW